MFRAGSRLGIVGDAKNLISIKSIPGCVTLARRMLPGNGETMKKSFCPNCQNDIIVICAVCGEVLEKSIALAEAGSIGFLKCGKCNNREPVCPECRSPIETA
jgi:hypothetical protein